MGVVIALVQAVCGIAIGVLGISKPDWWKQKWSLLVALVLLLATGAREWEAARSQEVVVRHAVDAVRSDLYGAMAQLARMVPPKDRTAPPGIVSADIVIAEPKNADVVAPQIEVKGHVADPQTAVWVIVRPAGTGAFWVQPPVAVQPDGLWVGRSYFGRAGEDDRLREFDLMAVANPIEPLKEGTVLGEWPAAKLRSPIVTVKRQ